MRTSKSRWAVVAVLAAALSACSLVPDYSRPAVPEPKTWDVSNEGAGVWPGADWWREFRSTELERLIAEAMENSRDLRAALARIRQAEAEAKIAGAALYPTLGLDGSATRARSAGTSTSSGTSTNRNTGPVTTYQGSATVAYQVDLFGENRAAARAAEQRLDSSRFDREVVAITLVSDVATTYFQVLAVRERRRLAEELLANAQSILELLLQRQRVGAVSDLEVAQQRSAVATQRATLPAFQLSERQSLDALALLLGRPPQGFTVAARSFDDLRLPPIVSGQPLSLLERRPDLRRAEADLRAANFDIGAARAARLPGLDLSMERGSVARKLSTLFDPGTFFYTVAAAITAPIFEGGRLEGQEELTRAQFQELAAAYQKTVLSAFRDVEDSLEAAEQNGQQFGFNREAYEQAREAYRLADLRYRVGTVDFLSVLEAQRSVFQSADAMAVTGQARFNALVGLYKALGGGWDGTVTLPAR